MLFEIETGKRVNIMYHSKEFELWKNRLSKKEFDDIIENLESMIDRDEIHTSSWMPGSNWEGTVYEPIYTKSCNEDKNLSGLCFGLFVWYVFLNRQDEWYFGKFNKNGFPINGMTYFRKKD
ncbi:MAG: hypothetical protein SCALA702_02080 [Melioribacteraceae bacterium]|nr:MAG: hypothetical protein SCALA702_02080 [Melioribacteraceae bacterium]